ncbi:MAG: hypothetical protein JNM80_11355 [Phycisphaerae bacterium]|nr:hypothetical protein [Phycisphaerae bacterium]
MIKILRKHRSWFMAGFLVLLMMTWLIGPAFEKIGRSASNYTVAKLDGMSIRALDANRSARELAALEAFAPFLIRGAFGIADRDATHWTLLVHEAEQAGLVADEGDGAAFLPELAETYVQIEMQRDFRLAMQIRDEKTFREVVDRIAAGAEARFREHHLAKPEMDMALARARGVFRLLSSYRQSIRLSDRAAAAIAKRDQDAAIVDHVSIPASRLADTVPEPTDEQLLAHFERFKSTRPGEGQFGIGYLLPPRVRIEFMKLSRAAIEAKIDLDPIEVSKRFKENPTKYGSDFAAARPNIERELKADKVNRILEDARSTIQAEVVKGSRRLDPDPKDPRYRVLPADWQQTRPKFESIAQVVVDQVQRTQGVAIDRPEIVIHAANWLTQNELAALPGIGMSVLRQGSIEVPFPEAVFWCRELGGERGIIPIQTLLPIGDAFFSDRITGDRYYLTVLQTRGESAPDSIDERREQIVKDYRELVAYEQLKSQLDTLRAKAVAGGLDAIADAYAKPGPAPATPGAEPPPPDKPTIHRLTRLNRNAVSTGDQDLNTDDNRARVLAAAAAFDPVKPWSEIDADRATLALSNDARRSISIVRIVAPSPLTVEAFRSQDDYTVGAAYRAANADDAGGSFSLAALLQRHEYKIGDRRINKPEDLRTAEDDSERSGG